MRTIHNLKIAHIVAEERGRQCFKCDEFISEWPPKVIIDKTGEFRLLHRLCSVSVNDLWRAPVDLLRRRKVDTFRRVNLRCQMLTRMGVPCNNLFKLEGHRQMCARCERRYARSAGEHVA